MPKPPNIIIDGVRNFKNKKGGLHREDGPAGEHMDWKWYYLDDVQVDSKTRKPIIEEIWKYA